MMKKVTGRYGEDRGHWVGDGFPVKTLFSYDALGPQISPFLLLDYAEPREFPSTAQRRGVGVHPHRGFETVTLVYEGEVEHRDSAGNGGVIGPGDVQWMTAASGVLHEEYHSPAFAGRGGRFCVVQLWVNLPSKDKMARPAYQAIRAEDIPILDMGGGKGKARIIAGELGGVKGPARTFTPMDVWDLTLSPGAEATLEVAEGHTAMVVLLAGGAKVNGMDAHKAQVVVLGREGRTISLRAHEEASLLILSGEPIDEPIAGYGPFVMNTQAEVRQTIDDFNRGRFARAAA
ncbi:MAG: pirin family protein [Caulobacteraceae bacterium]